MEFSHRRALNRSDKQRIQKRFIGDMLKQLGYRVIGDILNVKAQ